MNDDVVDLAIGDHVIIHSGPVVGGRDTEYIVNRFEPHENGYLVIRAMTPEEATRRRDSFARLIDGDPHAGAA